MLLLSKRPFFSHARRLLPKLANHRPPVFLSIGLVHRRQPSTSLNQRNRLHRNIRPIIITPLQVRQRPITSRSMHRHMLFGILGKVVDGDRTLLDYGRECGLFNPSVWFKKKNCLNFMFLIWYGSLYVVVTNTSEDSFYILRFDRDAYNAITCEDSFDILRFDQDTGLLRLCFRMFHHGPASYIYLFENTWYIFRKIFLIPSFLIIIKRDPERRLVAIRWEIGRRPVLRL